jgi:hypothetical protein
MLDSCSDVCLLDAVHMNDELKELIAAKLDVTEFLDILGLELTDILDKFEDEIEDTKQELHRACR